jgi:hypothetical protein
VQRRAERSRSQARKRRPELDHGQQQQRHQTYLQPHTHPPTKSRRRLTDNPGFTSRYLKEQEADNGGGDAIPLSHSRSSREPSQQAKPGNAAFFVNGRRLPGKTNQPMFCLAHNTKSSPCIGRACTRRRPARKKKGHLVSGRCGSCMRLRQLRHR